MRKMLLFLMVAASLTACDKWLDVNTDPNNATAEQARYYHRLPWCQFYLEHAWTIPGSNAGYYSQLLASKNDRPMYACNWDMSGTTRGDNAQQWFFTGCGTNLKPLYTQAMEAGAWHYAAAACLFRAFGFMEMVDLFGEIPYTEAMTETPTPAYDTGDYVFMQCLEELDRAIELFSKPQAEGTVPLSSGDSWNGGDTGKWLKMCYLLKARWLVKLSKKGPGSYKDGKYDAAAILDCLDKAPQSNADNTVIRHENSLSAVRDVLWKESVNYSGTHSCLGQNNRRFFVSKALTDILTDFAGNGIEDPRADKFIPWRRSGKSASSPDGLKWSSDGLWMRSQGVDLTSSIIKDNGPAHDLSFSGGKWTVNSPAGRQGDTVYVAGHGGYFSNSTDELLRYEKGNDASAISGAFHLRADTPTVMASYAESCLIRAEVLFNRDGATAAAFDAYKKGVAAHIAFVEETTVAWRTRYGGATAACPAFTESDPAAVDAYLDGGIGTAANLTLGKILTQKQLVYLLSIESWNDLRRYDYDPALFQGFAKPYVYLNTPASQDYLPLDKLPRRWPQASYETKYNSAQLLAIGERVPGAKNLPGEVWYSSKQISTLPVWWDTAE